MTRWRRHVVTKEGEKEDTPRQHLNSFPDTAHLTETADNDGFEDRLSPVIVREQRVAKARRIFGLNEPQRSRGDHADQKAADDHRTIDVAKVLQSLHHADDSAVRRAFQRLHVK